MTTPMKAVFDVATGKMETVPLTPAEIKELEQAQLAAAEEQAQREAEEAAKAEAKASAESKLAALGLTAEEIAALGL